MAAREIHIQATAVGTRQELGEVLAMSAAGKLRCQVATEPLSRINQALEQLRQGRVSGRIVLTPKAEPAERHPEIDAALAEGLADLRAGRLSPKFATMQEFRAWLKTPEGKKFSTT